MPRAIRAAPAPKRPRARRPTRSSRRVILFLAANPSGTTPLALAEECAAIERVLRRGPGRDDLDFRSKWAVSAMEMMEYLDDLQPTVIHFSGHGGGSNGDGGSSGDGLGGDHLPRRPRRDIEPAGDTGIQLQDGPVSGPALAEMIASTAPSVRVVVLNACSSDAAARTLCDTIDCVVSMKSAIDDDAARIFAAGFYRALVNCRSVANAVRQANALLAAKRLPGANHPVCRTRDGLSPDRIFLP